MLAKEPDDRAASSGTVLYTAAEGLRVLAVLLNPVMPKASAALWDVARRRGRRWAAGRPAAAGRRAAGGSCRPGCDRHQGRRPVPAPGGRRASASARRCVRGATDRRRAHPRPTYPPAPEPLRTPVLDSHCHLDIRDGDAWMDVDEALAAATAVGVPRIVQIGCDLPSARWAVDVAARARRRRRRRRAAPERGAAHPRRAGPACARGRAGDEIDALAVARPRARGRRDRARLLPHRRTATAGACRRSRSAGTSRWPSAHGKALVIHDRDAHDDVLRVLDDEGAPRRRRVPLLLRRRRDGAHVRRRTAGACRSRAPSRSRTRRPARRARRDAAGRSCWSRPTRRSSPRRRTAAGPTPPT